MTNPLSALFEAMGRASLAAAGRRSAQSIQDECDYEGMLLDEYRKCEQAYLDMLGKLRKATMLRNVESQIDDLAAAIGDNSPLLVWEDTILEMLADAGGIK